MGIRETAANIIGGKPLREERQRVQKQFELLLESQFRIRRDPVTLARELEEIDSQLLDLILEQRGWIRIGGALGGGLQLTDTDRLGEVATARYMTYYDAQSKNAVETWTDFGFGQDVQVVPRDTRAAEIWDEFWIAPRNRPVLGERVLHEQSNEAVIAGELFYSFWTDSASGLEPGKTTIRTIITEEISEIVSMPTDPLLNVWYVQNVVNTIEAGGRKYSAIAYRDWMATDEQVEATPIPANAIDASELRPNTDVVMLYASRNRQRLNNKYYRGFPEFKQAYEWFRAYKDALGDVMAKNRAVAMFVDSLTVKGGSRSIDALTAQLTSTLASGSDRLEQNPPPVAGSTWLQNERVDRTRLPLGTAAGDDQTSTMIVLGQGSAGTQVPLGWMGRPDSWQNRSVAEMTVLPWQETMKRYQSWWASVFRDMARIVLTQSDAKLTPEQMEVDVTLDTLITVAIDELVAVISVVTDAVVKAAIDQKTAASVIDRVVKLALSKFGVVDTDEAMDQEPGEVMERIIGSATRRLKEGEASAEDVAEWALAELLEVMP